MRIQKKHVFEKIGPNSAYVEELYELFLQDPDLVGETWAAYFRQIEDTLLSEGAANGGYPASSDPVALPANLTERESSGVYRDEAVQERIYRMVNAFRAWGHLKAAINPLSQGIIPLPDVPDVNIDYYQFSDAHLSREYGCAGFAGRDSMQLSRLIESLKQAYCGPIGFEFRHALNSDARQWLQERIETRYDNDYLLDRNEKVRRLQKIIDSEEFESELHRKYIGHKRFSLQGGEALIPMLDALLEDAVSTGIKEVLLGMAHRGRLNVLANTFGKPLAEIFSEFEDQNIHTSLGSGDVKYHLGFESEYVSPQGEVLQLLLCPNPSHLEFVDPVVEGMVRALQDREYGRDRKSVLPVLLHGDAAFIGQGVVAETLNLAQVEGYKTGGSVHIVINNQIGFTTNPDCSRSSVYCTDIAKAFQAPIFHVNGEDIDAVCWTIKTALEFRNLFGLDVIIDMYCYRRYGHNEGDDPSFTQPLTYEEIKRKESIAKRYTQQLLDSGVVTQDQVDSYVGDFRNRFSSEQASASKYSAGEACAMHGRLRVPSPETGVPVERLHTIADSLLSYPAGFEAHPKLKRILQRRIDSVKEGKNIDWGAAEALAYGSIVQEGIPVRLSGQDCGRGTFAQRHLEIKDSKTGVSYFPLNSLVPENSAAGFEVYNSTLSEAAVLGFEFGFATMDKKSLVLWEAQFGDFANGAQVIIDQFIASSEAKWNQLSGVVMLLPHGYEGQGPEHSSARLERYLQLCAEGNMVVTYPGDAAQYFHLLRRQALLKLKRPLIVMTPKSLLRAADAACTIDQLTSGQFQTVIWEDFGPGDQPEHVVVVAGKVCYDVIRAVTEQDEHRVRVIRVEQLYPFPQYEFKNALKEVDAKTYTWVQEEPANMGAWNFVKTYLRQKIGIDIEYVGRPVGASTAAGSGNRHAFEQNKIMEELLSVLGGGEYKTSVICW